MQAYAFLCSVLLQVMVVTSAEPKSCLPDAFPQLQKKGTCTGTTDLEKMCAHSFLEISPSKDCLEFDGAWCCYDPEELNRAILASLNASSFLNDTATKITIASNNISAAVPDKAPIDAAVNVSSSVSINSQSKPCTSNDLVDPKKGGFCVSTDNLKKSCSGADFVFRGSSDCTEFDGSWCCNLVSSMNDSTDSVIFPSDASTLTSVISDTVKIKASTTSATLVSISRANDTTSAISTFEVSTTAASLNASDKISSVITIPQTVHKLASSEQNVAFPVAPAVSVNTLPAKPTTSFFNVPIPAASTTGIQNQAALPVHTVSPLEAAAFKPVTFVMSPQTDSKLKVSQSSNAFSVAPAPGSAAAEPATNFFNALAPATSPAVLQDSMNLPVRTVTEAEAAAFKPTTFLMPLQTITKLTAPASSNAFSVAPAFGSSVNTASMGTDFPATSGDIVFAPSQPVNRVVLPANSPMTVGSQTKSNALYHAPAYTTPARVTPAYTTPARVTPTVTPVYAKKYASSSSAYNSVTGYGGSSTFLANNWVLPTGPISSPVFLFNNKLKTYPFVIQVNPSNSYSG